MASIKTLTAEEVNIASDVERRNQTAIRLDEPYVKFENSRGTEMPLVGVTFNQMIHSEAVEEQSHGWFLESDLYLDAVEPLTLAEAIYLMTLDTEDDEKATELAASMINIYLQAAADLAQRSERAITDEATSNDTIRMHGFAKQMVGDELGEYSEAMEIEPEEFSNLMKYGTFPYSPDKFREWRPKPNSNIT